MAAPTLRVVPDGAELDSRTDAEIVQAAIDACRDVRVSTDVPKHLKVALEAGEEAMASYAPGGRAA